MRKTLFMKRIKIPLRLAQHVRYGLTPLPFGTLPSATPYMLGTLGEMSLIYIKHIYPIGGIKDGKITSTYNY
jgi:hypothetical protein